jgi:hypothetical protein
MSEPKLKKAYTDADGNIHVAFSRLEMEDQIMKCWGVTSDLDDLFEGVMEHGLSQDQIANALMGMKELYQIRFDRLFRTFEAGINQKKIT